MKNQIAEGSSNKYTIPAPSKGGAAQGEVVTDHSPPLSRRYQPFPTDLLPEPVRGFVETGAKAIGCDESLFGSTPLDDAGSGDRHDATVDAQVRMEGVAYPLDRGCRRERYVEDTRIQAGIEGHP